jgi:hypothetical protein
MTGAPLATVSRTTSSTISSHCIDIPAKTALSG